MKFLKMKMPKMSFAKMLKKRNFGYILVVVVLIIGFSLLYFNWSKIEGYSAAEYATKIEAVRADAEKESKNVDDWIAKGNIAGNLKNLKSPEAVGALTDLKDITIDKLNITRDVIKGNNEPKWLKSEWYNEVDKSSRGDVKPFATAATKVGSYESKAQDKLKNPKVGWFSESSDSYTNKVIASLNPKTNLASSS